MKINFVLVFLLFSAISFAQSQMTIAESTQKAQVLDSPIYKLFPTENFWTFIKLDTRNGKMWQLQFTVNEDNTYGQYELNTMPLTSGDDEIIGRFTLHSTKNTFNFLLLDQITGKVYQVQWAMEENLRGIVRVF
jgi:hypothetical protein